MISVKDAQSRGDLAGVLAAKKEIATFKESGERVFVELPDLKRLRATYETACSRLANEGIRERIKLYETFRREGQNHIERLTRLGQLPEAVRLSARITEMDKLIEAENAQLGRLRDDPAGGEEVLWEFTSRANVESVKNCGLKTLPTGMQLFSDSNDGAYQESRKKFKPPFRIEARVATDSTNIRFYYNKTPLAIFNWEMNPDVLRIINDTKTGRNIGFEGKGRLAVEKMYDIGIEVYEDKIIARVNGKKWAENPVDSAGLDGAVGIGPAFGSVLTLESFRVLALKP